ncbi:hypothetical protein [Christensenella intestinihominis]|uniref:hypothetical protein n=1 Tax=Christensenella intestinihominis TaxID=1851429 RepID=UPI00082BCC9D|nr:hypothetical protein [Christensenella intestinihominis]
MAEKTSPLVALLERRNLELAELKEERERMKKQMCQFCRAHDKKAGITPVCAADCEWREKETKNENNSRA